MKCVWERASRAPLWCRSVKIPLSEVRPAWSLAEGLVWSRCCALLKELGGSDEMCVGACESGAFVV